jgi:hypothetical protein
VPGIGRAGPRTHHLGGDDRIAHTVAAMPVLAADVPLPRARSDRRHRQWPSWTVVTLLTLAAAASACGGSPSSVGVANVGSTTTSTPAAVGGTGVAAEYANGLKYAHCMQTHGEPEFPDPRNPGGFSTVEIEQLNPTSHAFTTANTRCVRLLPNDGQPSPTQLQQTILNGLRFARCMRGHGQPNFPDPGLSGGQITINFNNIDPNSPQYLSATKACATVVTS